MTIVEAIRSHLQALGMTHIRTDASGRNGVNCAIAFRNNGAVDYVQITSYDDRILLSWAVQGFTGAEPLLDLCREVEFDLDGNGEFAFLKPKAMPKEEIVKVFRAAKKFHCVTGKAWALRNHAKIRPNEYWHIVLKEFPEAPVQEEVLKALTKFWRTRTAIETARDVDDALGIPEGAVRVKMIIHRQREAKLRERKIDDALAITGQLACEVPGCGFDFKKRYGSLGSRYAEVHHLKPLAARAKKGALTRLEDLAIVCANCHRMIHRGGECLPLEGLIKVAKRSPTRRGNSGKGVAV